MKERRARRVGAVGLVGLAGLIAGLIAWMIARAWPAPPVERASLASLAFVPLWSGLAIAALAWRRRERPGHARRSLFALHRSLGGALTLIAMLVFGSGVGAVLDRSLSGWQVRHGELQREVPPPSEQALDAALAELLRLHPDLARGDLALHPASASHPWIQADFFDGDRKPVRVDLDPATGVVIARGQGPLWVLRELHRRLLIAPLLGESALGVIGLGLGLVLLSGLSTRRWLRPRTAKPTQPRPVQMRVHQWIGVSLLPAAVLWAWTGALLGLTLIIVPIVGTAAYAGDRTQLMRDVLAVDRPPLVDRSTPPPNLRELVTMRCPTLREHMPDAEAHRLVIHHPTRTSATIRVDLEGPGLLARGSIGLGADGHVRDCRALASAGPGLQGFMAAIVLHYGEWEGAWLPRYVVDAGYLLLGSALLALAWLGGCLLARRRERENDSSGALRLRRSLTAVLFGLGFVAVGLALQSRIPGIGRSEPTALWMSLVLAVAVTLHAFHGELERRRRELRMTLALALLLVPLVGWLASDVTPGAVEVAALLGALAAASIRSSSIDPNHPARPTSPQIAEATSRHNASNRRRPNPEPEAIKS